MGPMPKAVDGDHVPRGWMYTADVGFEDYIYALGVSSLSNIDGAFVLKAASVP